MVKQTSVKTMEHRVITWGKVRYGWSKYGGPMYGIVRSESEWICQACGDPQPHGVAEYVLPIDSMKRDYVRICAVCKHVQHRRRMTYYHLIQLVRKGV